MNQNTLSGIANLNFDFEQARDLKQLADQTDNILSQQVTKLSEHILKP